MPALSGDTRDQAAQQLEATGFVLRAVHTLVDNSCRNIGTVMSQNPVGGHLHAGESQATEMSSEAIPDRELHRVHDVLPEPALHDGGVCGAHHHVEIRAGHRYALRREGDAARYGPQQPRSGQALAQRFYGTSMRSGHHKINISCVSFGCAFPKWQNSPKRH